MNAAAAAQEILSRTLVWDSHGCIPLRPGETEFLPQLIRYHKIGVRVVGINVGFDAVPWWQTFQMLAHFRNWLRLAGEPYALVETTSHLERLAKQRKKSLGIFFDVEGGTALNGQLSMVELYRDLGVRWMLIAYNRNNALGGGCQDEDCGLTKFGRSVIAEMERVGMTVCCSHTGFRTSLDVMRRAQKPVICSHSNPVGMWRHKRNIRDEVIKSCAATGGVVGVTGINLFLGKDDKDQPRRVAEHIDYVAQLVGIDHVGLGFDYFFDQKEVDDFLKDHPDVYPAEDGYDRRPFPFPIEQIPAVIPHLLELGHRPADVRKVFGENFLRVARATWPKRLPEFKE